MTSIRAALLTTAAMAACAGPAWAQQQQAQAQALEEIVVTARQRSESLQEIPLSIAAFSAEDIRETGLRDLGDIARTTTGITFNTRAAFGTGGRINSQIRVRGISAGAGLPHLSAVSLFVDGVYSLGGANVIPLNDLERVEVIKGPQSAFFGRNTFAGAINYITKNPSLDNVTTQLDVSAATYNDYSASVLTGVPLVDGKLAAQVNARLYSRGAQYTATDGGGLGKESSKTGSFVLYAKPIDELTVKARVFYQKDDDGHPATAFMQAQVVAPNCLGRQVPGLNAAGQQVTLTLGAFYCGQVPEIGEQFAPKVSVNTSLRPVSFALVRRAFDGERSVILPAAARPDFLIEQGIQRKYIAGVPTLDRMGSERNNLRTSLNIDYEFLDGYNFHAVGGYNDQKLNYLLDFDRTDVESWYTIDPQTGRDYSAEARVSSPGEDRFRWLAGATYYDQKFITSGAGGLAISSCVANLPGFPPASQCNTTNGIGPSNNALPITGGNLAEVWGVYGSISFDITEELTLDIEGRYLEDKRTAQIIAGTFRQAFATTYKQTTPRFILNYKPTNETTLYAQASRGTLPGTTNGLVAICSNDPLDRPYTDPVTGQTVVGYIDTRIGFPTSGQRITLSECAQLASQFPNGTALGATPSQKLDALEVGWKQVAFDQSLRFNLTGYYYKWKNLASGLQVRYTRDADDPNLRDRIPKTVPNTLGVSVPGTQELYGAELESGYAITENWDAQVNLSWNKNKWIEFQNTSQPYYPSPNRKGKTQILYPKWLLNITSTYNGELTADWGWYVRGDANYTSKQWVDFANLAWLNDYWIANAALGVKRDDMRIELFVRNLFDEDAWISGSAGVDFSDLGSLAFTRQGIGLVPQDKRSFGIRMNYNF
jgi:iron complex outermembrane receptor protein